MIDSPAFDPQECSDLAISVATILPGQANEGKSKGLLVLSLSPGGIALGTAGLIQYLAGAPLTAAQALAYVDDCIPYLLWA